MFSVHPLSYDAVSMTAHCTLPYVNSHCSAVIFSVLWYQFNTL